LGARHNQLGHEEKKKKEGLKRKETASADWERNPGLEKRNGPLKNT